MMIDRACAERGCPMHEEGDEYVEMVRREWVGLTRDEVLDIEEETTHPLAFYDAIEAKLKERNS